MRFMRLRILIESTVLFFLSWVAVLKMSQWLISLNDAINSFYIMIRDNLTIIGSYWVIGFQFIATFGIIGYLIFATKLFEFRYWWEVVLTMIRHFVTPMDARRLGEATVGCNFYANVVM